MFQNWGFLLTEIWVLLALASLLGLIVGWIIWGRRQSVPHLSNVTTGDVVDRDRQIAALRTSVTKKDDQIATLQSDLAKCHSAKMAAETARKKQPAARPTKAQSVATAMATQANNQRAERPVGLDGPRDGVADDIKKIRGVGRQMEQLCNDLGFYHFDQIASWTPKEVAWVDANLQGFTGRVTRDNWVPQAKVLASGGETEFSKKVDQGGVYSDDT